MNINKHLGDKQDAECDKQDAEHDKVNRQHGHSEDYCGVWLGWINHHDSVRNAYIVINHISGTM